MAADMSSSSLCSLFLSEKANGTNIDVVDNTVSQNFRVIRITLLTRIACIMVGERSRLYVRMYMSQWQRSRPQQQQNRQQQR